MSEQKEIQRTVTVNGRLCLRECGESDDILFVSGYDEPLADYLQENIACRIVTARYWITATEKTKDEAIESYVNTLCGKAHAKYQDFYSDITGYLWTDEEVNIGGHDLLNELGSHIGKWLILEIDIHAQTAKETP